MYILAADDEPVVLEELLYALRGVFPQAQLRGVTDSAEALQWAESLHREGKTLDYAFLDIRMPGMDGMDLARRIKYFHPKTNLVFCTAYDEYAIDAFGLYAKGYLLKPVSREDITQMLDRMVDGWQKTGTAPEEKLRIQTFGHFEVFFGDQILRFEREKAKELLAYLVDRRGASVTTEQIAAVLWEDRNYDRSLKNQVTATVASLKRTLESVDAGDVLIKTWNHLAIDRQKILCDAYDFEQGDAAAVQAFRGEYMFNYSWAEATAGRYSKTFYNE